MTTLLNSARGVGMSGWAGRVRRGWLGGLLGALLRPRPWAASPPPPPPPPHCVRLASLLGALAWCVLCSISPRAQAQGAVCQHEVMGIPNACLWLKADDGAGTPGSSVGIWQDRSGNDKDMTGVGNPSVVAGSDTEGMNFNPVVRFNGSNQSVFRNESTIGTNASEINVFFVSRENARQYSNLFSHSTRDRVHLLTHWPWSDGNLYWDTGDIYDSTGNCCVADHRHYTAAPFKKKVANLGLVTNSVRANTMEIVVNAKKLPDRLPSSPVESPGVSLVDDSLNITSLSQGPNWYNGDIPEFLEFRRDLDAPQRTRVQSYLALKYGLTLDQNGLAGKAYTNGNDASVYSYSDYWNSIIGIGRDSVTTLDQRVSRSMQKIGTGDLWVQQGDSPLTIATSADFTSADFTSANGGSRPALQPGQYLVLGDNNGDVATLGAATAEQFGRRIGRVWRAQNTGGVGAVHLGFDPTLLETNFPQDKRGFLLVSTDADFSVANTTRYALGRVTVGSKTVFTPVTDIGSATPVPVTIPNGSYITLGQESVCTGTALGIADACLWLKANDGDLTPGGTVSTWPDRSGSQKNLTGVGGPSVVAGSNTTGMNFNPVVRFNGVDQVVKRNESPLGTEVSKVNIFFAMREVTRKATSMFTHSSTGVRRLSVHWALHWTTASHNNRLVWDHGPCCDSLYRNRSPAPFAEGTVNLGLVTNNMTAGTAGTSEIVVNAKTLSDEEPPSSGVMVAGIELDKIQNEPSFNGDIAELLEFKSDLDATQRTRVQSYLALKYGLTLDRGGLAGNAYTSGGDKAVYSDSNYWNSIIGLGRDSVTGLDQRVSRSTQKLGTGDLWVQQGDSPLTIATSADFTSANGGTRRQLDPGQYLVLGDNNGALNALSASAMGRDNNRLPRVWRAQNTGVRSVFLGLDAATLPDSDSDSRYPRYPRYLFVESGAGADGSFPADRTHAYALSNLDGYWVPVAVGAPLAVNIPSDGAYLSYGTLVEPQLSLTVQSRGGTGTFGFSGTNGFVASSATTRAEMQPVAADPATQTLSAPNAAVVITVTTMPATTGWRLESGSCIDRRAAASGNPSGAVLGGVSAGNQFTIPAAQAKASADLHCALVARYDSGSTLKTISGRVFVDNGAGGGGVANDGKINGAETGRSGAALSLTNCGSGGTTIYAYTSSSGDGSYSLKVPPTAPTSGTMCIAQTLIDDYRVTQGGADATGADASGVTLDATAAQRNRWRFNYAGADVQNLHIGNVPSSRLLVDGTRVGIAGSTVDFPHRLIAGTAGTLTFGVSDASPAASGWSEVLYRDFNCNAQLDAGEPLLGGNPTAVEANENVCVIVRQFVPAGLYEGATRQFQLQATLNWANAAPRSETLTNRDHTQVSGQALRLYKEVRNVTTDERSGTGHESWTTSNSAKPGETLEYRTTFTNLAPEPITKLEIYDATPNYTTLVSADCPAPLSLPAGLTCEPLSSTASPPTKPADGGTGPLRWRFNGPLPGGTSGAVKYRVKVNE